MSDPKEPDPKQPADATPPEVDWIDALYQQGNQPQPPEVLDERIVTYAADAANAAKKSKASANGSWRHTFSPALASAAVMVLAVGIVLRGGDEATQIITTQEISDLQQAADIDLEHVSAKAAPNSVPTQNLSRSVAYSKHSADAFGVVAEQDQEAPATSFAASAPRSPLVQKQRPERVQEQAPKQAVATKERLLAASDTPQPPMEPAPAPAAEVSNDSMIAKLAGTSGLVSATAYSIVEADCIEALACRQIISHESCQAPYLLPDNAEEIEITRASVVYNSGKRVYEVRCTGGSWLAQSHTILD